MLRKAIFTSLALALAWGLGNALYEIWMSGEIHVSAARSAPAANYSYSGDHAKFLLNFSVDAFGALCGVLLTLGLGWMKPRSDAKKRGESQDQHDRMFSRQGRPFKLRLYVTGIGFSFVVVFAALNILGCYLHHVPIPGVLWSALVGGAAVTGMVGRALIRLLSDEARKYSASQE